RQYRLIAPPAPDQGHDAALHQLWRILAARAVGDDGHGSGAHTAPRRTRRPHMTDALPLGDAAARPVVLAAGGTGGHVFPAQALAAEMQRRGHAVAVVTDSRGAAFEGGVHTYRIRAASPTGSPAGLALAARDLGLGSVQAV